MDIDEVGLLNEVSEKILTTAITLMDSKLKELMSLKEYGSFTEELEKQAWAVAEKEMKIALMAEFKKYCGE